VLFFLKYPSLKRLIILYFFVFKCGADHVKVQQKPPLNLPIEGKSSSPRKYCSLDGDADRIVYYYLDNDQKFRLLDGDKIASIAATHLKELVQNANLSEQIRLSIVQTAYANGSSTNFIENFMVYLFKNLKLSFEHFFKSRFKKNGKF
jgi:hypothetical protein